MKTSTNKTSKNSKTTNKTSVTGIKASKNSSDTTKSKSIDPEKRRQMIAEQAYILAEKRGFTPGNEVQDWIQAEAIVDSKLKGHKIQ